jgi:hypothetical protein
MILQDSKLVHIDHADPPVPFLRFQVFPKLPEEVGVADFCHALTNRVVGNPTGSNEWSQLALCSLQTFAAVVHANVEMRHAEEDVVHQPLYACHVSCDGTRQHLI